MPTFVAAPQILQIRGKRVITRLDYQEVYTGPKKPKIKSAKQIHNEANLKKNKPSGIVTYAVQNRMNKILVNWIEACRIQAMYLGVCISKYLTFVTLTLPSPQMHTDKELNRKCLDYFLTKIQRKFGVQNYFWRAEKQKNGNLHYHLVIDKFIKWNELRYIWNGIMTYHGYVSAYQKRMKEFHHGGIKYRHDLAASGLWSYAAQRKAYQFGQDTNWLSPNSTDIKKIDNKDDLAAYLCKYMSKDNVLLKDLQREINPEKRIIISEQLNKTRVDSRLWGCSDKVKSGCDYKVLMGQKENTFLKVIQSSHSTKCVSMDFCDIYYSDNCQYYMVQLNMFANYQNHYTNLFSNIYSKPSQPDLFSNPPPELSTLHVTQSGLTDFQLSLFD